MSPKELGKRIDQLTNLIKTLSPLTDSAPENMPPVNKVERWEFGAKVIFSDGSTELLSLPPKVGRFNTSVYNQIIQLINLNGQTLLSA